MKRSLLLAQNNVTVHGYLGCHSEGAIFLKKKGDRRISLLSGKIPVGKLVGTRPGARFFSALRYVQNDIAFFRGRLQTNLLVFVLICFSMLNHGTAQEVGDRVVVTASLGTKIHRTTVGQVYEGDIHTISSINGKWCALNEVEGWLPLQNVMNLDRAMDYYNKRVNSNRNDFSAFAHRGMIFYEVDEFEKAYRDLSESLKINNRNAPAWSNRGRILNAQQKYVLALNDLGVAIKLRPDFPHAHYNLGRVYYSLGDCNKAIEAYSKAIELNDKNPRYFVNRGSARLLCKDLSGARDDYQTALKLNKRNADAHVGLSNLALAEMDLDTAFTEADRAVELQPQNAMAINARGWVLYKQGKVDEAIFDLSRSIRYAPKLSLAYNNRGVCYASKQEFGKAIADYDRLLDIQKKSAIGHANRGVAYLGKGDFDKAKFDLEEAVKLSPEMTDGLNSLAWFLATCPDGKYRDGKLAVEKAKQACELSDNKDWSYLMTLAAALAEVGKFSDAIETSEQAQQFAPEQEKPEISETIELFKSEKPYRSQVGKNAAAESGGANELPEK